MDVVVGQMNLSVIRPLWPLRSCSVIYNPQRQGCPEYATESRVCEPTSCTMYCFVPNILPMYDLLQHNTRTSSGDVVYYLATSISNLSKSNLYYPETLFICMMIISELKTASCLH